jgi:hypothetical protein
VCIPSPSARPVHTRQDGRVNTFYSTPSAYARAKLATTKLTLKTDDFFPYADCKNCQWAGYFVSRAALKGYVRDTSSVFNAARQLQALTGGAADLGPTNTLYSLERAVSLVTHHDGVSGTEKQAVAYGECHVRVRRWVTQHRWPDA